MGYSASGDVNININAVDNTAGAFKSVGIGVAGLLTNINDIGSAAAGIYSGFSSLNQASITVEQGNLRVDKATRSLAKAQNDYNDAVATFGLNSPEAQKAANDLAIAQDALGIATDRQGQAQANYNQALMNFAFNIVPTVIRVAGDVSRILTGLSGQIGGVSEGLGGLGSLAGGAGVGVAGGVGAGLETGGFGLGIGAGGGAAVGEGMVGLGGALTATAMVALLPLLADFSGKQEEAIKANPALKSLMMIRGGGAMPTGTEVATSTVGEALKANTAAIETQTQTLTTVIDSIATQTAADTLKVIADMGYFSFPGVKFQHGGVVTEPTLALVGEAGPEAIIPLDRGGVGTTVHIHGPLFTVEGSVDRRTADYVVAKVKDALSNVIIEPSSSSSSSTHKRIRFGS